MPHEFTKTARGFNISSFKDRYGEECSLQESSLATESAIWLGVNEPNPQIMASVAIKAGMDTKGQTTGWIDFPMPKEVYCTTRMHLTQKQVAELLPHLIRFVETGEL